MSITHAIFYNMNKKFTWSTTERGDKAILYNKMLYGIKRTTRPRKNRYIQDDNKLILAKKKFIQDKDFDAYQKVLSVSHRYIDVIKHVGDSSDEE